MSATRSPAAARRPRSRAEFTPPQVRLLLARLETLWIDGQLVLSLQQYVVLLAGLFPGEFAELPGLATAGPPGTPKKAAALAARVGSRRRLWSPTDADYVRDDRLGRESVCTKAPRHGPGSEVNHPQALGRYTKPGTVLVQTATGHERRADLCDTA